MGILLLIFGFVAGIFLWAAVLGTLFLHLPGVIRLKRAGIIHKINLSPIVGPILFSGTLLVVGYVLSLNFAWGASYGAIAMLFNLGHMRKENVENIVREYNLPVREG